MRPLTAAAAAQLAGNDPRNESARKAELRRIFLMEAAHKVAQAEERVRKREVRLAELEKSAKELKDKAAQRGGTAASGAAKLGNLFLDSDSDEEDESEEAAQKAEKAQERADEEWHQVELAKRELEQAQSEKQKLLGAGPSA